jgi:diacylglycerol kinase (ATP)
VTASLLVCNPLAGLSTPALISRVREALAAHGPLEVMETAPGETTARVASRLGDGLERVYVLGGDGSVGDVAGALTASAIPLGIIPCGTTNVVARECRIPLRPLRAVEALVHSRQSRPFHTWSTGRGTLILAMGVGFDARLMLHTPQAAKRRWGLLAVGVTAFREAVRYDFPDIEIEGEDEAGRPFKVRATFVLVANTQRYAGEAIMLPQADPSDDLLDLLVFSSRRRGRLVAFWGLSALPGTTHLRLEGVTTLRARRLRIASAAGVEVHLNGDPHGRTPVTLEPSGLVRLIVPE